MTGKRGPPHETEGDTKRHTDQAAIRTPPKGIKLTNKHLNTVAQVISSAYEQKGKKNFGKPFSEILVPIPEE